MLRLAGIETTYLSQESMIQIRLSDGTVSAFPVEPERSGIITLLVFASISALTIGLLTGNLGEKIAWFMLSIGLGCAWNTSQLVLLIAIVHTFGFNAFTLAGYVLAPSIDIMWIVSLWALGMSWLKRRNQHDPLFHR